MAFFFELDDARPEVRKGVASTAITHYARVDGEGLVAASSVSGECKYTIYDSNGDTLQASTNITPSADPDGVNSKFTFSVPAIAELQEDAYIVVEWQKSGDSERRVNTIYFDVVLQPWGASSVAINDLLAVRPDAGQVLDQQAARIGGGLTRESLASIYGSRAHTELYHWIRSQISAESAGRADGAATITRPRLILDKTAIHRVETILAVALVYEGDMTSTEATESDAAALFAHYSERAKDSFRALGPLRYDATEDRVVDTIKPSFGRAVRMRRLQG